MERKMELTPDPTDTGEKPEPLAPLTLETLAVADNDPLNRNGSAAVYYTLHPPEGHSWAAAGLTKAEIAARRAAFEALKQKAFS
jgi:hypothetical protein